MDVEYISLHGYTRNTPSDTEVHAALRAQFPMFFMNLDIEIFFVEEEIETLFS